MRKRFLVVGLFFLLVITSIGTLSFGNKLSEKILLTQLNKLIDENYFNYSFNIYDFPEYVAKEKFLISIIKKIILTLKMGQKNIQTTITKQH